MSTSPKVVQISSPTRAVTRKLAGNASKHAPERALRSIGQVERNGRPFVAERKAA